MTSTSLINGCRYGPLIVKFFKGDRFEDDRTGARKSELQITVFLFLLTSEPKLLPTVLFGAL